MTLPSDYSERVYAGVLGKIIGVYLGRPFEQWRYEQIMDRLGTVDYYVHDKLGKTLVVTDDDISGTFTFARALSDYGYPTLPTAEQIGQTWLNYIIENKTILWWGGMGMSTEHTAFLRLKSGIPAPRSGSIALNGKTVAEQIGSQIFIDGWAMVSPGDPERAAELALRAASVSHDGEAIYGAQVISVMEAMAFVESDFRKLLDCALGFIPRDCTIRRSIDDLIALRATESDWRNARAFVYDKYGYEKFPGGCHIVPNHALIILALLWGDDDFQKSLSIVNTSGYDTDCNAANVGCLLGIKNGLAAIDQGPDWRGPVADRILLSTADGGRCITDAAIEAIHLINAGRAAAGQAAWKPKDGARFHFELPGSVQGFCINSADAPQAELKIENVVGHSQSGQRSLAIRYAQLTLGQTARFATATFIRPDDMTMEGYTFVASPTLYPGQTVRARIAANSDNASVVDAALFISHYTADNALARVDGPSISLKPGESHEFEWTLPRFDGQPIAEIGLAITSQVGGSGTIFLDYVRWDGTPDVVFEQPTGGGDMWRRAWVDATNGPSSPLQVIQNSGRGLVIQGTREWTDYEVSTQLKIHMASAAGIAARVQGLRRYYALILLAEGQLQLIRMRDTPIVLASKEFDVSIEHLYALKLQVEGSALRAWVDDKLVFETIDHSEAHRLKDGGIAILCDEGRITHTAVTVGPVRR